MKKYGSRANKFNLVRFLYLDPRHVQLHGLLQSGRKVRQWLVVNAIFAGSCVTAPMLLAQWRPLHADAARSYWNYVQFLDCFAWSWKQYA